MNHPSDPPLSPSNNHRNGGKPFALEVQRTFDPLTGDWRSHAFLKITSGFRRSGLLHALPAEELKTLLTLATFVTPSGYCAPTVEQVAHALQTSEEKARKRLERLAAFQWEGKPLVVPIARGNGAEAYTFGRAGAVAPQTVPAVIPASPPAASPTASLGTPPINEDAFQEEPDQKAAAKPARDTSSPEERSRLAQRLVEVGLEEEAATWLIDLYGAERVQRQLDWLPDRYNVREPARFLKVAIERDFEAPRQHQKPSEKPF